MMYSCIWGVGIHFEQLMKESFRNWGWISGTQIPCSGGSLRETACGSLEGSKESMAKRSFSQVVTSCELFSAIYNISKHIVEFMRTATCRLWKSNLLMNLYSWAKISIRLTSQIRVLSICGVSIWSSVCRWSCLTFFLYPTANVKMHHSFPCVYKTTCFKTWHIRQ